MKVKSVQSSKLVRIAGSTVSSARGGAKSSAPARPGGQQQDDVALSAEARIYSQANESILTAPEIREERIQPIREALAAGRYDISSLKVADKILRQVLQDRKRSL